MSKAEIDDELLNQRIKDIELEVQNNDDFFFYFSPDPDAIGASIAFGLYLTKMKKNCILYLPNGFDYNLGFLLAIAKYNSIKIYTELQPLRKELKSKVYTFICCDTPTYRLLPDFKSINRIRNTYPIKKSIEIDHHFGGDSDQIFSESISIFYQANSCCDILAHYFYFIGSEKGSDSIDQMFPRNVVLSLIVGMCYDTQFGKFIVNENNYNKWFNYLSDRLTQLTWGNSSHLKSAHDVYKTINIMSKTKMMVMTRLVDNADYQNGIGLLILPLIGKYESLADDGDSSCILAKISSDIANMLPENAGKIGIFCYYDDVKKHYLIKMRRSTMYKDFDLRDFETTLREVFGKKYLGGGGHAGATSFRIKKMEHEVFVSEMHRFFDASIDVIRK